MKRSMLIILAAALIIMGAMNAMAIEEAAYQVVSKDDRFELRDYTSYVLAEIVVEADLEGAGNKAFNTLFRYISGDNQSRSKVAMTAPVSQQRAGQSWAVSFMMPGSYTLHSLPEPDNPEITLRQVPARRMAAVRYSGFWNEKNYLRYKLKLESWIDERGLNIVGDPIWARYNPPFTPWFFRRNEILIPVDGGSD